MEMRTRRTLAEVPPRANELLCSARSRFNVWPLQTGSYSQHDPESIRTMFDRVAHRYDFANHFLSAGCDFWWRRKATAIVRAWQPACVLDLATGSGDLALALQSALPESKILGVDFSAQMLAQAKRKGVRETMVADAMSLPFASGAFDAVTVAFGLRNMRDWSAALREMRRVLTRRGQLLVLDFSLPRQSLLRAGYRVYLHHVLPILCHALTGEKKAYDYLGDSIEKFPSGAEMIALMNDSGFRAASADTLTGGVVTIYTASAA